MLYAVPLDATLKGMLRHPMPKQVTTNSNGRRNWWWEEGVPSSNAIHERCHPIYLKDLMLFLNIKKMVDLQIYPASAVTAHTNAVMFYTSDRLDKSVDVSDKLVAKLPSQI